MIEIDVEAVGALVHSIMLLTSTIPLGLVERRRRTHEIRDVLDTLAAPVAVFTPTTREPLVSNQAWNRRLGRLPPILWQRIAAAEHARDPITLDVSHDVLGVPAHYSARVTPLRGCLGAPFGVVITCCDITERVLAQRFGVPGDALIWSGPLRTPANYHNRPWSTRVGDSREWDAIVHPADIHRCSEAFTQAGRQRASAPIEARLQLLSGEYRWHRIAFVRVTEEARWYGTAVDIHDARNQEHERNELLSDARAARADAELATRLKDEFLATVAHELRAPLMTMLLWAKVMRDPVDERTREQALDAIYQSALAQSRIVGDLLDVSRAVSGKLHIDLRPVSLGEAIAGAVEAALPAALARRIELTQEVGRNMTIVGDATRLRQVLDNVLANAIKFTEPGGRVVVAMRAEERDAVITVRDSGRGIAPDQLELIFKPFYQSDDLLTRREGGLGLGLAISRQLVTLHGGSLTAASDGVGRGATFTIRLPATQPRRARTPSPEPPGKTLARKRVLLVDDDMRVRDALFLLLTRAGAIVDTAASAAEARTQLARGVPDLVICDIAMPDEDGYSFIRIARADGISVPAIALTGHAQQSDAERALDAGFDLHLAKPVRFESLVSSIDTLMSSSKFSSSAR